MIDQDTSLSMVLGILGKIFSFSQLLKIKQTFAKTKDHHTKYNLLCSHHWQNLVFNNNKKIKQNFKTFLWIWRENGVIYSCILWNFQM